MAEEDVGQPVEDTAGNYERVTSFIRDQVKGYMEEVLPTLRGRQEAPSQRQQQEADNNRLIAETIAPVVGPHISQLQGDYLDLKDKEDFYYSQPDAKEHREDIEALFSELKKQGRMIPRSDLHRAIVGKKYLADPDKFVEDHSNRKKNSRETLDSSVDFGAAMFARAKDDPKWSNFSSLSVEEMEKALDGITF